MEADQTGGFISFIPMLLIWITTAFFAMSIAKRKGRSRWIGLVISFPLFMLPGLAWLVSLPDKEILERITSIEKVLSGKNGPESVDEPHIT